MKFVIDYFKRVFGPIIEKRNSLSPFDQIRDFNKTFSVASHPLESFNDPSYVGWNQLDTQIQLLEEEFNEVKEAVKNRDVKELRDGTSDVIVIAVGAAHIASIPLEDDLDKVYKSNMSKLVNNSDELKATVQKYSEIGVGLAVDYKPHGETAFPAVVKSAKDVTGKDGKFYPKGKILKSIAFREPKFF